MATTTLECDLCEKKFEAKYDGSWEDLFDAAWNHSCPKCGMVLCPSHYHHHECEEEEGLSDKPQEP